MTGFHRAQLFELLTSVKLASNVLVRIVGSECPSISLSAKKKCKDQQIVVAVDVIVIS